MKFDLHLFCALIVCTRCLGRVRVNIFHVSLERHSESQQDFYDHTAHCFPHPTPLGRTWKGVYWYDESTMSHGISQRQQ